MKKKLNIIIVILFAFFVNFFHIRALNYKGCEYSQVSRLKSIISNVNITYDYYIKDNIAYFNITINNITPEIYFEDGLTSKIYTYYDTNDGEITIYNYTNRTGKFKFYSALNNCYGIKLSDRYYTLPEYNYYFTHSLCKKNPNSNLCKKWASISYSPSEFEKIMNENSSNENEHLHEEKEIIYEKTYLDGFDKFYVKYYYFILIGIIVICVSVMIISRKKNSFDLK